MDFLIAAAAETAGNPVTWDQVGSIAAWTAGGIVALVLAILLLIAVVGGFRDWSH